MNLSIDIQDRAVLPNLLLFRDVSLESIEVYLDACKVQERKAGEVILSPDQNNNNLYLLMSGQLSVHLDSLENPPLIMLKEGELVGEMSLIENKAISAYVVTDTRCRLLIVDYDTLWALVNASHEVARNLLFILSGRIRFNNSFISKTVKQKKLYEHFASVDTLTGINNRRQLDKNLKRQVSRSEISNEELAIIMMDIDNFKQFNDNHGHLGGDRALYIIAQTLKEHLRPNDMAARFGGDEFVVILPRTCINEANMIAERVREAIGKTNIGIHDESILPSITLSLA